MSATVYQLGNGTTFSVSIDGGTTYILVKQCRSITLSGGKADYEDITNLDSTGSYREWAPTLRDAGNAVLDNVFNPLDAGQLAVFAGFNSQALLSCKIQFPKTAAQTTTGDSTTFTAYVSERPEKAIAADKTTTFKTSLKISGPITEVAGS